VLAPREHAGSDLRVRCARVFLRGVLPVRALAALVLLFALGSAGCVRRYVEPGLDQPHALVKIRTLHHARSGPQLDLAVRIAVEDDEFGIEMPGDDSMRVVRVRPLATSYRVVSAFFHTETRMRTVYETEQYQCGTTTGGYGHSTYSQPRYCSRQVTRQRLETVRFEDGSCEARAVQFAPLDGAVYLVQYDYFGPGVCSMTCMRQLDTGGGTFQFVACGSAEPPVMPTSGGEAYQYDTVPPPIVVAPPTP
jgi:hypothetical protein